MKILFATHFFPYPPDSGGNIGIYNPIKYLSRKHEIILFSLVDGVSDHYINAMREFCTAIVTFRHPGRDRWSRLLRGAVGQPPGTASKYFSKEGGELLRTVVRKHRPDVVELQHLNMAAYLPYCGSGPAILREHNIEYRVWERYAASQTSMLRRLCFRHMAARVRAYEADVAGKFARCLTVSKADAAALRTQAPSAHVESIPSGVDCEYFAPAASGQERPYSMVMTGSFAWRPKQHNLRVLIQDIFPRIRASVPQATLSIVGQGVHRELKRLAESHGVVVTGAVPDVRPYIQQTALVLNYMEVGGGIALKVLEGMAMRKPVLSNREGVEGISAIVPWQHVAVANGREEFAAQAAALLQDATTRRSLAEEGYNLVRREYAWHRLVEDFDQVYAEVLAQREMSSNAGI